MSKTLLKVITEIDLVLLQISRSDRISAMCIYSPESIGYLYTRVASSGITYACNGVEYSKGKLILNAFLTGSPHIELLVNMGYTMASKRELNT